jgi:hypothetical protein
LTPGAPVASLGLLVLEQPRSGRSILSLSMLHQVKFLVGVCQSVVTGVLMEKVRPGRLASIQTGHHAFDARI